MFVDQVRGKEVFPALKGGTAVVTVEQVAEAAVGAMENGVHRGTYAICSYNMKFKDFYQMMVDALGQTETTQVPVVEYEQMLPTYQAIDAHAKAEGKEHGMHMVVSAKLQTEDLFLDPKDTMPVLGIKEHDVEASIKESLKLCV